MQSCNNYVYISRTFESTFYLIVISLGILCLPGHSYNYATDPRHDCMHELISLLCKKEPCRHNDYNDYYDRTQKATIFDVQNSSCSDTTNYTGEMCINELLSALQCYHGSDELPPFDLLKIPTAVDQQRSETYVMELLDGLSILNPSERCKVALVSLICLQTFVLCDMDNIIHAVDDETCITIRDILCPAEWEIAMKFPDFVDLPVCEDLPPGAINCMGMYD